MENTFGDRHSCIALTILLFRHYVDTVVLLFNYFVISESLTLKSSQVKEIPRDIAINQRIAQPAS